MERNRRSERVRVLRTIVAATASLVLLGLGCANAPEQPGEDEWQADGNDSMLEEEREEALERSDR